MLNGISWNGFVQGLVTLLIIYYVLAGMLFYRYELRKLAGRIKKRAVPEDVTGDKNSVNDKD